MTHNTSDQDERLLLEAILALLWVDQRGLRDRFIPRQGFETVHSVAAGALLARDATARLLVANLCKAEAPRELLALK
jgi:hypothetical protein